MDPLTHCLLGAATAGALAGPRLGRAVFLLGALAAELPDLDVVIPTDPALPMEWHRHFTHALCCAPLFGALAALPFMIAGRWRREWKLVLAAAIAAACTHGVLDMCTSYGTYWLWPFINRRLAWDVVSIIDPLFTGGLIVGVTWALIARTPRPARAALGVCLVYLGLGTVQHHRAAAVQRSLAESRGDRIERGRVMPTLGNLIVWRSIYVSGGRLHADAVRAGAPGAARAAAATSAGQSLPLAQLEDLPFRAAEDAEIARVFEAMRAFADGYVAKLPEDPRVVGDMRYSLLTGGFEPLWGIKIEHASTRPIVTWVFLGGDRRAAVRRIWSDVTGSASEP
jgi:inner membrane protein